MTKVELECLGSLLDAMREWLDDNDCGCWDYWHPEWDHVSDAYEYLDEIFSDETLKAECTDNDS